jgi:hypothetical protein
MSDNKNHKSQEMRNLALYSLYSMWRIAISGRRTVFSVVYIFEVEWLKIFCTTEDGKNAFKAKR